MSGAAPRLSLNIDTSETAMQRPRTPEQGSSNGRRQSSIEPATPITYAQYASPLARANDPQYAGRSGAVPMSATSSVTTIADLPERQQLMEGGNKFVKAHQKARSSVHFDTSALASPLDSPVRPGSVNEIVPVSAADNNTPGRSMSNAPLLGLKQNNKIRNSQIHLPHDAPGAPIQATYIGEKRQYGALGRKYRILRYVQAGVALVTFVLLIATVTGVTPYNYTVFFFEWFYVLVSVAQLWLYYLPFCVVWNRYVAGTEAEAVPDRKTGRGKIRNQVAHDDWCMLIFDFCTSGAGIIAIYAAVCRSVRCAITTPGIWDFITDDEFYQSRAYYQRHGGVCAAWHVTLIFEVVLALLCIVSWFTTLGRIRSAKKAARRMSMLSVSSHSLAGGDLEKGDLPPPSPAPAAVPAQSQQPSIGNIPRQQTVTASSPTSPRSNQYVNPTSPVLGGARKKNRSRLVLAKDRVLPRHHHQHH